MLTQNLRAGIFTIFAAGLREFAGIFAVGVIGTRDKRTKFSTAQGKPALPTFGTKSGISAVFAFGKEIW